MKKFSVFLIILVLLGGAGFFAGWVELALPLGSVGVLRSKSHGVAPAVVKPGGVHWVWYRLIPTNTELLSFKPEPVSGSLQLSGVLPQADAYKRFAGNGANFAWQVTLDYSFTIDEAALPALVSEKGVEDDEGLARYAADIASHIERAARRVPVTEEFFANPSLPEFLDEVREAFPQIAALDVSWTAVSAPDFALYRTGEALYNVFIDRQRALLEPEAGAEAARNIANQFRFDELERYGELFSKYPSLLEYIQLEKR